LTRGGHKAPIHVVAAAVIDLRGRVLIAQRPAGKHLAGGWEFPGGKLEPGEDRRLGLARELREELGISIATPRPLIRVRHSYDYGDVLIDMWVVRRYSGEPRGLDLPRELQRRTSAASSRSRRRSESGRSSTKSSISVPSRRGTAS